MFWTQFQQLCQNVSKSPNGVAKELGLSSGTVTFWKNGKIPKSDTLKKIADYFGVTVDYLLGNDQKKTPDIKPNAVFLDMSRVYEIPVFETVSAGFGAIADDCIVDYTPLYITDPGEAADTICIKVKGDSMYPKIEDGDIIQVRKQDSVDSGTIAVILLDGEEGLVKRVVYGDGWLELQSINPYYKPMRFTGGDIMRVRVVGVVRKLIKNF